MQTKSAGTVLTVKCIEVAGPRVRDLQHPDCRDSPDGGACRVLDDGSQAVVRHIADKSRVIDTEVRGVPEAMAAVRVALQSRAVRPTKCALELGLSTRAGRACSSGLSIAWLQQAFRADRMPTHRARTC